MAVFLSRRNLRLFRLFGFQVRLDVTWFFLAFLVAWTLAVGYFPFTYPGLSLASYIFMGIAGALGLFFSIIFHELCHSLVSRRHGHGISGITLFMLGGVAEMEGEPPSPKAEFWMAVVGPAFSFFFGFVFLAAYALGDSVTWPIQVQGVLAYMAGLNFILAVFNLLPGFPLDGGRILRSILWAWKKDLLVATRIASKVGSGIAVALMFLALLNLLRGNFVGGIWLFIIGMFLRAAAIQSYQQLLVTTALEGQSVERVIKRDAVVVSPDLPLERLVRDYFYRFFVRGFPVVARGRLEGCVSIDDVRRVREEDWARRNVWDAARPCSDQDIVDATADLAVTYRRMRQGGRDRLYAVEADGQFAGVVLLQDLLGFVSFQNEIKGVREPALSRQRWAR